MKQNRYQKPAMRVLDARFGELMWAPGGGVSESDPGTPGVYPSSARSRFESSFEPHHYSVWDEELRE